MTVDPVMYIFLNQSLGMTVGKAAAQAAHAAVEAFRLTGENSNLTRLWYKGNGHKKVILAARDEAHMHTIVTYIRERGFGAVPIIDEGRTEVPTHSFTAIGVELVDKNEPHAKATFEDFEPYREPELNVLQRELPEAREHSAGIRPKPLFDERAFPIFKA